MNWQNVRRQTIENYYSTQTALRCADNYGVGNMSAKQTKNKKLTEREIDETVIAHANDDSAWGKPIRVRRKRNTTISIPSELATRAEILARLHRQPNAKYWITRVIQERVELEEAAYTGAKRELLKGN